MWAQIAAHDRPHHAGAVPSGSAEMRPIERELRKLTKDITLVVLVKETHEFKVRMWLAKLLWALGVKIAGCRLEIRKPPTSENVSGWVSDIDVQ